MNHDFTIHRLKTEITELEKTKKNLDFELTKIEPEMKREKDLIDRRFGTKRVTLESKLRQTQTGLRSKKTQLQQIEKQIQRDQLRNK